MLYRSIITIFSKVSNDRDGEQICGCQGLGTKQRAGQWRWLEKDVTRDWQLKTSGTLAISHVNMRLWYNHAIFERCSCYGKQVKDKQNHFHIITYNLQPHETLNEGQNETESWFFFSEADKASIDNPESQIPLGLHSWRDPISVSQPRYLCFQFAFLHNHILYLLLNTLSLFFANWWSNVLTCLLSFFLPITQHVGC